MKTSQHLVYTDTDNGHIALTWFRTQGIDVWAKLNDAGWDMVTVDCKTFMWCHPELTAGEKVTFLTAVGLQLKERFVL